MENLEAEIEAIRAMKLMASENRRRREGGSVMGTRRSNAARKRRAAQLAANKPAPPTPREERAKAFANHLRRKLAQAGVRAPMGATQHWLQGKLRGLAGAD